VSRDCKKGKDGRKTGGINEKGVFEKGGEGLNMKFLILILIMGTVLLGSLYSILGDTLPYCEALLARHSALQETITK
jgi:hypothetical protein